MAVSAFQSIYAHEQEHRQMLLTGANDGMARIYKSMTDFENDGSTFKLPDGPYWIAGSLYYLSVGVLTPYSSDGIAIAALDARLSNAEITFIPSIYNSTVSATTTATGQSEARATGAMLLKVVNNSANSVYIALGQSNIDAESNLTSGVNNVERFLIPVGTKPAYINIANYSHYAWLGNGATVSVTLTQGV